MTARSHSMENNKKQPASPTPAQGMFQPRPFVVQPQTEEPEQPDIKTALQRAERYGHRLDRIKSIKPPVPAPIPRIVQAKLTIGQPGDRYEQEADRVAAQVVNQIHAPTAQRQEMPEEDELQMKPEIGSIQRQELPEEDEELQMKPEPGTIERQELPEEDEELQMQPTVQLQSNGSEMTAQPDLEASIQQARGSGQPLASTIKEPMEQAFGADFSGVKVHTDAQSDQLNRSIQARAFTTGQDVFFRQGEYNPGSRGGQELLAHELTHVVQQSKDLKTRTRQAEKVYPTAAELTGAGGEQRDGEQYIQRNMATDLEVGLQALTNSSTYYNQVQPELDKYRRFIEQLGGQPDEESRGIAEKMAEGYKVWGTNWYNKTQAYLYEGQKANNNTWVRPVSRSIGILGVDTDLEADLEVHVEELQERRGKVWRSSAEEFKASTSPNESAVQKLCVDGIKQLAKREEQKDKYQNKFDRLILTIHNGDMHNIFPFTETIWNKAPINGSWNNVTIEMANTQLLKRMEKQLQDNIKETYIEIRLEHNGSTYAGIWYNPCSTTA